MEHRRLGESMRTSPDAARINPVDKHGARGGRRAPDQPGVRSSVPDERMLEQLPGVSRATHSARNHAVAHALYERPEGSAAKPPLITAGHRPNDTTIAFDETGEYQFRIEGQNCTASARRSKYLPHLPASRTSFLERRERTATGVQPQPTVTAATDSTTRPARNAAIEPADHETRPRPRCSSPGEPTRLEVRPLANGSPRASASHSGDRSRRRGLRRPTPRSLGPDDAERQGLAGARGNVTIAERFSDGTVELMVSFAGRSVPVFIEVASPARSKRCCRRDRSTTRAKATMRRPPFAAQRQPRREPRRRARQRSFAQDDVRRDHRGLAIGSRSSAFCSCGAGSWGSGAAAAGAIDPGRFSRVLRRVVPRRPKAWSDRAAPGRANRGSARFVVRSEFPPTGPSALNERKPPCAAGGAPFPEPGARPRVACARPASRL